MILLNPHQLDRPNDDERTRELMRETVEFFETNADESDIEFKLKAALEGGAIGLTAEGAILTARAMIKALKAHKASRTAADAVEEVAYGAHWRIFHIPVPKTVSRTNGMSHFQPRSMSWSNR